LSDGVITLLEQEVGEQESRLNKSKKKKPHGATAEGHRKTKGLLK